VTATMAGAKPWTRHALVFRCSSGAAFRDGALIAG
jgi:hypothetical protein